VDSAKYKATNGAACKSPWPESEVNAAWNHMARHMAHAARSSSRKAKTMGAADFTAVAEELGTKTNRQVKNKMTVKRCDYLELVAILRTESGLGEGLKFMWKGDSHLLFGTPHSTSRSLLPQFDLI
jgi:hypothetical protein